MKRILYTWLLAIVTGTFSFAAPMDDGHTLTALWKQYEEARKADRPQKEAEILSQIKQEAMLRHLPVDFYDAATEYVNTVSRRDWKQQQTLREALEKEVKAFDDPMVTFHWMNAWKRVSTDELWAYVKAHPDGFQGHTPAFYRDVQGYLGGTLKPFIRSDKEYVLWSVLRGRSFGEIEKDEMYQLLLEEVKGRYPNEAALEYYAITHRYYPDSKREKRREDLIVLAGKYAGKAASLYPKAELLQMRKEDLDKERASGNLYRSLCESAQLLEKERKAYTGTEASIAAGCKSPAAMVSNLTASDVGVSIRDGNILVTFQNLKEASLTLRQERKTVKSWKTVNPVGSFYVLDTLTIPLPKLADGDYTAEAVSGKLSDFALYTQYTLSLATRTDSRGPCIYVADYQSGEPLSKVTVHLWKGDKEVAKSSLRLDGFTPLPDAILKQLGTEKSRYSLSVSTGERKSRSVNAYFQDFSTRYDNRERCLIYKDQGAYNPGDTVRFKAVVFKGDPAGSLQVCKDKMVEVLLCDSEGNTLQNLNLKTNAYGAVSGCFALPRGLRNGRFKLEVKGLASDWFRVDEFVLPTYELSFDTLDQLYMVGDEIPVSGRLTSFSGHSLSGARVAVKVESYGTVVLEEEAQVKEDNTFRFLFPASRTGYYNACVTVTDATGETLSFNRGYYVGEEVAVDAILPDAALAELTPADDEGSRYRGYPSPAVTLLTTTLRATLQAKDGNGNKVPLPVRYKLLKADETVLAEGEAPSGKELSFQLPSGGYYRLSLEVSATKKNGTEVTGRRVVRIFCLPPQSRKLPAEAARVFIPGDQELAEGGAVTARLGSGEGTAYALVSLYGEKGQLLESRSLTVPSGTLQNLSFPYKASYPDKVRLQVFYFLNGKSVQYDREYRRLKDRYTLPLEFTRFQDKAYPGTSYTFTLKTAPDAEVLVAAWDKSLDAITRNYWSGVSARDLPIDRLYINTACGSVGGDNGRPVVLMQERAMTKSNGAVVEDAMVMASPAASMAVEEVEEEGLPFADSRQRPEVSGGDIAVRSNFASALTFQPHLRPEADGTLTFSFRTGDKLSTYYVRALSHDMAMRNTLTEKEMVVSLPVKVALVQPRFLYEGDVYDAAVSVSSITDQPVSGTLVLVVAGKEVSSQMVPVTVQPGQSVSHRFRVTAPSCDEVTLKAVFKGADFSDALQVTVPVYAAAQELTEAHSAVLRAGEDREALLKALRSRFVNIPSSEATLREITVLDMVKDAIPSHVEPSGKDVISLSEAWYIRLMASRLGTSEPAEELLEKILACRNADGGFAWFEGMTSSPAVTALLLERFAKLRDRGFSVPEVTTSVKYLDNNQFADEVPYWRGGISDAQYLHIRSLYPGVPFQVKPVSETGKKRWNAFQKWAKDYLVPSGKDGRGLVGQILAKSRRLLTLRNLLEKEGGVALAGAWGVSFGAKSRMQKSLKADLTSLLEYAVEHRDGGWYYPNAVMPWRGLMESEAYAHALLCDLLSAEGEVKVPDGIRLWLMLQKETQHWDTEPAYIDAITSILDGSEAVLDTRVLALSGSYRAPFEVVKASGNGFTIERKFYKEVTRERVYDNKTGPNDKVSQLEELQPGDPVSVGDKILVKYKIWNGENRSFVRLTAAREGSLQPVQQLSGYLGYGFFRPWSGGSWRFTPQGYRNVKASCTEYYFDSYPEENTELSEEFYVQQAGTFVAPVTVIESLYAPHYRANSAFRAPLVSFE